MPASRPPHLHPHAPLMIRRAPQAHWRCRRSRRSLVVQGASRTAVRPAGVWQKALERAVVPPRTRTRTRAWGPEDRPPPNPPSQRRGPEGVDEPATGPWARANRPPGYPHHLDPHRRTRAGPRGRASGPAPRRGTSTWWSLGRKRQAQGRGHVHGQETNSQTTLRRGRPAVRQRPPVRQMARAASTNRRRYLQGGSAAGHRRCCVPRARRSSRHAPGREPTEWRRRDGSRPPQAGWRLVVRGAAPRSSPRPPGLRRLPAAGPGERKAERSRRGSSRPRRTSRGRGKPPRPAPS
jgi:hypothetical protein